MCSTNAGYNRQERQGFGFFFFRTRRAWRLGGKKEFSGFYVETKKPPCRADLPRRNSVKMEAQRRWKSALT